MISIVIPIYNTEPSLFADCMESVYSQTFQDFEVVVVDNGSEQSKIDEYLKICDNPKVRFLNSERVEGAKNISIALNKGVLNSQFELIARMDSDDLMHQDRLRKQFDFFRNEDVDILGGQIAFIGSGGIKSHPPVVDIDYCLRNNWVMNHPTVMFKKQKIVDAGLYRDKPNYLPEDFELWARCLSKGYRIRNLQEVLVFYRLLEDSQSKQDMQNRNYNAIFAHIRKINFKA
jgi:glycosyltransferase involved in cell wall biosynthesis